MLRHKTHISLLVIALFTLITGGWMIVSSQVNPNRIEISSPSGSQPKPDHLKVPTAHPNHLKHLPPDVPHDVAYRQIFKHLEELHRKADKEEQLKGKDGKKFRNLYKEMARLDEKQARMLDRIAIQTNRELKKLDERAKQIIDQVRSQTPNRRI